MSPLALQLVRERTGLVERVVALLGIAGYFPSHIRIDGDDTLLMFDDDRWLARVRTEWPDIAAGETAVHLAVWFAVPPLAPRLPALPEPAPGARGAL